MSKQDVFIYFVSTALYSLKKKTQYLSQVSLPLTPKIAKSERMSGSKRDNPPGVPPYNDSYYSSTCLSRLTYETDEKTMLTRKTIENKYSLQVTDRMPRS